MSDLKIRISGQSEAREAALAALRSALVVKSVSDPYPNRTDPGARVYVEADLPTLDDAAAAPEPTSAREQGVALDVLARALTAAGTAEGMVVAVIDAWRQQGIQVAWAPDAYQVRLAGGELVGAIDTGAERALAGPVVYHAVIAPQQWPDGFCSVPMPGGFLPVDPAQCAGAEKRRWLRT